MAHHRPIKEEGIIYVFGIINANTVTCIRFICSTSGLKLSNETKQNNRGYFKQIENILLNSCCIIFSSFLCYDYGKQDIYFHFT